MKKEKTPRNRGKQISTEYEMSNSEPPGPSIDIAAIETSKHIVSIPRRPVRRARPAERTQQMRRRAAVGVQHRRERVSNAHFSDRGWEDTARPPTCAHAPPCTLARARVAEASASKTGHLREFAITDGHKREDRTCTRDNDASMPQQHLVGSRIALSISWRGPLPDISGRLGRWLIWRLRAPEERFRATKTLSVDNAARNGKSWWTFFSCNAWEHVTNVVSGNNDTRELQ